MNDSQPAGGERRVSPPTPKMLEFAQNIAKRLGRDLPPEVPDDFDACRAFLDANKEAASGPSEKQVNFARMIADRKGVSIPPETLKVGKLLSAWIDANK